MKPTFPLTVCISLVSFSSLAMGEEKKKLGYDNTPIIPGTEYHVHDGERPQPRIIQAGDALTVKAPSDAKLLFKDGSLDQWTDLKGNPAPWLSKDGVVIAAKKSIRTKEEFGAVQVHFQWRLPKDRKVNGQSGGNSGIFFMNDFEVQILQSNNNKTYPDGQAAAIYGQYPPLVNATSPQGEWNSYDIIFEPAVITDGKLEKKARVTVIHNGVVVQNAMEFIGTTLHKKIGEYSKETIDKAPLKLQFHGDPLEFRNMWIRPLGERDVKS